jgi:hypothetical protein
MRIDGRCEDDAGRCNAADFPPLTARARAAAM